MFIIHFTEKNLPTYHNKHSFQIILSLQKSYQDAHFSNEFIKRIHKIQETYDFLVIVVSSKKVGKLKVKMNTIPSIFMLNVVCINPVILRTSRKFLEKLL